MKKMRLVALDIDGTLLDDSKQIPPENVEALRRAQEAGIYIAIASGRMVCTIEPLEARLGIDGILIAYNGGMVIDERPPLSFTSDKSTECYRNWFPGPGDAMVRFMNRSIDLLEKLVGESDNYFHMNRRGYVFITADPDRVYYYGTARQDPVPGSATVPPPTLALSSARWDDTDVKVHIRVTARIDVDAGERVRAGGLGRAPGEERRTHQQPCGKALAGGGNPGHSAPLRLRAYGPGPPACR